jgi:hypothetical protein
MAIKANASSQGGTGFKKYLGVGSFRVMGVNPTKEEMEKFYGREIGKAPEYFKDKQDNEGKAYKQLRVTFLLQADLKYEDGKPIKENAALKEPLKTSVSFFIDSRYFYNSDKTKVQVIDKYGRTAWVTIEQCKNHQIPVYANGPAKLDADYKPAFRGEEVLTQFILNYLNVTPIETYNKNTGTWIVNPHPDDCEGNLYEIKNYFKGDISELKKDCSMMPNNRVKLLMGVQTDDQGNQYNTVYSRHSMRNGAQSYTQFKDSVEGQQNSNTIYTQDHAGIITNLVEYNDEVKESDLSKPAVDDPFAAAAALPEAGSDLPFGDATDEDPFA